MKKLIFVLCAFFTCAAHAESLGIAAVVNDSIITTSEVEARYNMGVQGARMQPDEKIRAELRHQALESLIDEQIRLQEAKRLDVMPTTEEIDESFAKVAAQNRLTADEFKTALAKTPGVYDSLRHQLTTQGAWSNVVRKKIRPQVNVTENDINAYLVEKEKNPAKVEYEVAEIFLKNNEANQKMAQQLVEGLKSGKQRFSVLARQFSQGIEAGKGGMLGWTPENRLEPVLDEAIKKTPVGHITDPIISPRGIHIFLVRDKRDIVSSEEGSRRYHIKQVTVPVPPSPAPDVLEKLTAQAKFFQSEAKDCKAMDTVIQKINSPIARDMGEMRYADIPAAVQKIVHDLPDDKASDPVATPSGLAIVMVCGRSTDNAKDAMRDDAANIIGTERLNRLQFRYYRDLRSAAYVDIKQN